MQQIIQRKSKALPIAFNVVGYTSLLLTLPAVLENMWEVYWLTISFGPQMFGYVLAHANPDSALVRVLQWSSVSGVAFRFIGLVCFARLLVSGRVDRHIRIFCWATLCFSFHGLLAALYPYWSPVFERNHFGVP